MCTLPLETKQPIPLSALRVYRLEIQSFSNARRPGASRNTRRAGATAAASRSSWANPIRSCRAGASAASRSSWGLIGGCGLGAGLGLGARSWGRGLGGWAGGLGAGTGAGAVGSQTCRHQACPCASVASRTVPPAPGCTGHCQCKQLCQRKRIQQHPPSRCHKAAEVDPAAAGPVPVLPVEAAGGLLGAAGWGLGWG